MTAPFIQNYKREIYLISLPIGALMAVLYLWELSLQAMDIRFIVSILFGVELLLLFFILLFNNRYLATIETVFYSSLFLYLLLVLFFSVMLITPQMENGDLVLGDVVNGTAMWIAIAFLGAFLSLSLRQVRLLTIITFLGFVGIAVVHLVFIEISDILPPIYILRWMNAGVGLLVAIILIQRIGEIQRKYASTDALTGVANRYTLYNVMEQEKSRSERYERPFSLMIIDIDHFKAINDRYGHMLGDKVLVEFSEILIEMLRKNDMVGRWGGEEFLVILPETDLDQAYRAACRIQQKVLEHAFLGKESLTASFGVAMYENGEFVDALLQRADQMLYQAKAKGRNRIMPMEIGGI
jgi:diguanylate cyclase (GGDEF)-like protein